MTSGDAAVLAAFVLERDAVDGRPVQVEIAELAARALLELGDGADADVVAVAVGPQRQRRAPEALARQRPVDVVLEPVAEAPLANVLGHPFDAAIELDHALPVVGGADVPGVLGVIDQRVAGAPAERIVVQILLRAEQQAALAQDLDDRGVGVFEELAGDGRHGREEITVLADGVQHRQAVPLAELQVVLAVSRRDVHDARAVFRRHELGRPNAADVARHRQVVEQALVAHAVELATKRRADDFDGLVLEHRGTQRLRENQRFACRACTHAYSTSG